MSDIHEHEAALVLIRGTRPPRIVPVRSGPDLQAAIGLLHSYAASLDVDLAYQDFAGEMAAMPGKYAPPMGELLLAHDADDAAVGCVALRPLDAPGCCEMKRLYVSPQSRGSGTGRRLIDALLETATRIGYRHMLLDTLPSMSGAQALYRKAGFHETEPYYSTPVVGTLFMRRSLQP